MLEQFVEALRMEEAAEGGPSSTAVQGSAALHGPQLRRAGLGVAQVFHDYGDLCRAIVELATDKDMPITTAELRTFNRCLEDAIAGAVSEHERTGRRSSEGEGQVRLGSLAHELRNRISNALLAFDILRSGAVGIGGSTGTLLKRNLLAVSHLIDMSLIQLPFETEAPKPPFH